MNQGFLIGMNGIFNANENDTDSDGDANGNEIDSDDEEIDGNDDDTNKTLPDLMRVERDPDATSDDESSEDEEDDEEKDEDLDNDQDRTTDEEIPKLINRVDCSDSEDEKIEEMRIPIESLKMNQGFLIGMNGIFNENNANANDDCVEATDQNNPK